MGAQLTTTVLLLLAAAARVSAQGGPPAAEPFGILDNSFLVEEAFNQDPGTFQSMLVTQSRGESATDFSFTQEWALGSVRHQFGYTIPVSHVDGRTDLVDVVLSYRFQVWTESEGRPAFAPRVSAILPSGRADNGSGSGEAGWQVNLPFSRQQRDFYLHGNAGFTWLPGPDAFEPHVGASAIWNVRPLLNLMLEVLAEFTDDRATTTLSPGARGGWNVGRGQVILGAAVPVALAKGPTDASVLLYVSYEGPYR